MGSYSVGRYIPKEKEYLYIDGGSLRSAVEMICNDNFGGRLKLKALISSFANDGFSKIFYYDALDGKKHDEGEVDYRSRIEEDCKHFAKISALDRFHVALGKIVGPYRRQKGVDVRLAVDMITHSFRGIVENFTLFTSDADFVPLVNALVEQGMHVTLWHTRHANSELRNSADTAKEFKLSTDHHRFTFDGTHPALRFRSASPIDPQIVARISSTRINIQDRTYVLSWCDEVLSIISARPGEAWNKDQYVATGLTMRQALMLYDAIYNTNHYSLSEEHIFMDRLQ